MNAMPSGTYSSQQARQEKIPSGYKKFAINQFTPEQEQLLQSLYPHLGSDSFLSRLASGEEGAFSEMESPALRQFGELQGGLASRFSGMGMGSRNSSGFQNASTAAAQDFASQLQSKRMELRNQAIRDLMGLSNTLMSQRPQEIGLQQKEKKSSGWGGFLGGALGGLGGFLSGGPAAALGGAKLGYNVGSQF